jgi:predicted enzyme related to lactoylglutathione lyase
MKVDKLERVALNVPNLDEAIKVFSLVLGLEFEKVVELTQPDGKRIKAAISSKGLELLQEFPPLSETSIRSFHFRVPDLEQAKEWVEHKGGKIKGQFMVGKVKEMVCDIYGVRIIIMAYEGDNVIAAME